MQEPIQVREIWKTYGKRAGAQAAVCGLSLSVPAQSVYGFLGPNGAGKSTTIRMILGLQRPDRGTILLFGRPLRSERLALLRRIGSLVEAPSLYSHLTGRENLEVHRRLLGGPGQWIDEALDTVDLFAAGDRLVRNYSSGMKQRLGLALALLGKPELLVLDEPTNGLDPAGIHEVRSLIRELPGRASATVFLSSHLLTEVEQVATQLAILRKGTSSLKGLRGSFARGAGRRSSFEWIKPSARLRCLSERDTPWNPRASAFGGTLRPPLKPQRLTRCWCKPASPYRSFRLSTSRWRSSSWSSRRRLLRSRSTRAHDAASSAACGNAEDKAHHRAEDGGDRSGSCHSAHVLHGFAGTIFDGCPVRLGPAVGFA